MLCLDAHCNRIVFHSLSLRVPPLLLVLTRLVATLNMGTEENHAMKMQAFRWKAMTAFAYVIKSTDTTAP